MSNEYDYLIKTIIVGEPYIGKSTLLNVYCDNFYSTNYYSTIGVDFKTKIIEINNKKIKIQIWDTAGQEKFRSIINSYYQGAHCIILMFDLTNINTFDKLEYWYQNIKLHTNREHKIILVGSKADEKNTCILNQDQKKIFMEKINEFATKYKLEYMEISSKNNYNIDYLFNKLIKSALDDPNMKITQNIHREIIKFDKKMEKQDKKCFC